MTAYAYSLLDAFSIIVLLMLLVSFHRKGEHLFISDEMTFKGMLIVNIIILAADFFTWLLDGRLFPGARALNMTATVVLYVLNPLISSLYLIYCDQKMNLPDRRLYFHIVILSVIMALNAALSLVGIYTPTVFELDAENIYHRGPLLWLTMLFSYLPVVLAVIEVISEYSKNRFKPDQRVYSSLMLFPIPALIGGILQSLIPALPIVWVFTSFSMLIVFLRIQNAQIGTDSLTGLSNRTRLTGYLPQKLRHMRPGGSVYCVMLDLDSFNKINDSFGHQIGNEALMTAAKAMTSVCRRGDFVSRYGGDEFVIIAERESDEEIAAMMNEIQQTADRLIQLSGAPYSLTFSFGYSRGDGSSDREALISAADHQMYVSKSIKKAEGAQLR